MYIKSRQLISALLAFFMIFVPILAFAENKEPAYVEETKGGKTTVTLWKNETYEYAADLGEEKISVTSAFVCRETATDESSEETEKNETGRHCFGIKAEKEGYYTVQFDDPDNLIGIVSVHESDPEYTDGITKKAVYTLNEDCSYNGIIFKMREGEKEYAFFDEWGDGKYSVSFMYLGGEMISAETDGPLIDGFDYVPGNPDESGKIPYEMTPNINVKFSEGKTVMVSEHSVSYEKCLPGESVTAQTEILDREFSIEVPIVSKEELIKDFSLPENFEASCRMKYDRTPYDFNIPVKEIIVTLADGTEKTARNNEYLVLSNGRKYVLFFEFSFTEENTETVIPLKYGFLGLMEKSIMITPEYDGAWTAFKDLLGDINDSQNMGANILMGTEEGYTAKDALPFLFSSFRRLKTAIDTYKEVGKPLNSVLIVLLFLLQDIVIVAVVILLIILIRKLIKYKKSKKRIKFKRSGKAL